MKKTILCLFIGLHFVCTPFCLSIKYSNQFFQTKPETIISNFLSHMIELRCRYPYVFTFYNQAHQPCTKCTAFNKLWDTPGLIRKLCIEIIFEDDLQKIERLLNQIATNQNTSSQALKILIQKCLYFIQKKIENYQRNFDLIELLVDDPHDDETEEQIDLDQEKMRDFNKNIENHAQRIENILELYLRQI